MKIVTKTYLLISILVAVAAINLLLLYQEGANQNSESHAIVEISDIKVKAESVSGFAISVASGNLEDKENLEKVVDEVDTNLNNLQEGKDLHGHTVNIPSGEISTQYNFVLTA